MTEKKIQVKDLASKMESKLIASDTSFKELQKEQKYRKNTVLLFPGRDMHLNCYQKLEQKKQEHLLGQLKAAESHKKIHNMRLRYQTMRAAEINHLIASQPTARKAIRLEALLPPQQEHINLKDTLDKLQRRRVEEIMNDEAGLTINRSM
uniref:protein LKAAEAR1-like n=1 Tax=Pristiophorus japonicus TaxID=55135 RepID=UPI00398F22D1